MAQDVATMGRGAERVGPFAGPPVRISWGAIFAGTVAALGVGILLYALGFALGLTAVDPSDPGSLKGSGIFTGIWSLVTAFIALFVGGMVASRGSGVLTKAGGALHGLVMWGFTTIAGLWLLFSLLGNVVSGVATIGKGAVEGGAAAVGAAVGGDGAGQVAEAFGLDANDALAPVNERLRREGKPQITASQLQAATQDVVQQAVRQGRMDRAQLVSALARNTALSRADAEEVATRIEAQFQSARGQVGQALQDVQRGALSAVEGTGKAFWAVFGALLLGMLSAVLGATVGVSKRQRLWAERGGGGGYEFGAPFPGQPRTNP